MYTLQETLEVTRKIAELAEARGGTAYFVGGFIRDRLLGRENKDVDVEIHGITPEALCGILDGLGQRITIGESFGIYGLKGYDLDIAMPRREEATGRGHRDFTVYVDPWIGTEKAACRRDFTMNAMLENVLTGEIIDHFGGRRDLGQGILRHVDDRRFGEDPLRVLRAAQFAARFRCTIAPETVALCRTIDLSALSRERVEGELKKALLKSETPSVFFTSIREMNQLETWFPELQALIGVEQNPVYHPEGDAWIHTLQVLDAAAALRDRAEQPYWLLLSALCHDLGKAVCTQRIDGVLHAYDHEIKGLPLARRQLNRLTNETDLIRYVLNMVELHMKPNQLAALQAKTRSTNRMFDRSVCPGDLVLLAAADETGKDRGREDSPSQCFLRQRLEAYRERMAQPMVTGKDLIDAGLTPDRHFSELLAYARKLHLSGVDREEALKATLAYARTK